ncbi:SWIM zinc finger family protein [Nocardioides caeni]|uniref:SWIM-type domain-containing protein n=1 Tax=Nocardioides caeni TaxID=574700 RepID=A0A4S8MZZ7_9ACTN|nr:SWIM zinc finger family protein [Nocardioides caeni]THV09080.1 hypothetical protein E9934_17370 [Nocardioides caeni]
MRTTYVRQAPPRRGVRSWWGKAWLRAAEEAAYSEAELKPGRVLARRGEVGGITVDAGALLAAVRDGDDAWTVEVAVPVLDETGHAAFLEAVAAESGRIPELFAGNLPHELVEHAEEVGVELLPYGGELASTCTCPHYLDPCAHAVAVLLQTGWLVDADPLVLLAVRGVSRDDLLTARPVPPPAAEAAGPGVLDLADDVEVAVDAALRARQLLDELDD